MSAYTKVNATRSGTNHLTSRHRSCAVRKALYLLCSDLLPYKKNL